MPIMAGNFEVLDEMNFGSLKTINLIVHQSLN
jgi:hypothetical protein